MPPGERGPTLRNMSSSDKYAIAAAIGMLFLVLFDNAVLMLVVSVLGLIGGVWVARGGEMRRAAIVALAAFAVAAVLAIFTLLR